ncbi:hypothetical protein ACOYA6_02920 [Leclercia barmai]|uniref:hypothetical protein n=1 Tax=Leclercia barmai TaxID=2785629 RepID=UPI003BB98EC9
MSTNHAHPIFTVPFSHNTDFTVLANHCERFAQTLLETDEPAEKLALCARRNTAGWRLRLTRPTKQPRRAGCTWQLMR